MTTSMAPSINPVLPMRFRAGTARFDHTQDGWQLLEPLGDERRVSVGRVDFANPFASVPMLHLGVAGFDIANGANARLEVCARSVSEAGFEVELETWLDTRIWRVSVSWLAIGH